MIWGKLSWLTLWSGIQVASGISLPIEVAWKVMQVWFWKWKKHLSGGFVSLGICHLITCLCCHLLLHLATWKSQVARYLSHFLSLFPLFCLRLAIQWQTPNLTHTVWDYHMWGLEILANVSFLWLIFQPFWFLGMSEWEKKCCPTWSNGSGFGSWQVNYFKQYNLNICNNYLINSANWQTNQEVLKAKNQKWQQ